MRKFQPWQILTLNLHQREANETKDEAWVDAVPNRRGDKGSDRGTELRSASGFRSVNQSQHDVVLEPKVNRDVPVRAVVGKTSCSEHFSDFD